MIRVHVTGNDIMLGYGGDCFRCAVAEALQRATGDDHANVYERDWTTYLEVWSRSIQAPQDVAEFAHTFDQQPRLENGRVNPLDTDYEPMEPFTFELPDQTDPEWQERCYGCEELFASAELDDEGNCPECRDNDRLPHEQPAPGDGR